MPPPSRRTATGADPPDLMRTGPTASGRPHIPHDPKGASHGPHTLPTRPLELDDDDTAVLVYAVVEHKPDADVPRHERPAWLRRQERAEIRAELAAAGLLYTSARLTGARAATAPAPALETGDPRSDQRVYAQIRTRGARCRCWTRYASSSNR